MTTRARSEERTTGPSVRNAWLTVDQAAAILNTPVITLRRTLERSARRGPEGGTLASVDGITARKLGRHWRVWLDAGWLTPGAPEIARSAEESARTSFDVAARGQQVLHGVQRKRAP